MRVVSRLKLLEEVTVSTPCRLHFTLIDLNGALGRIDGGVGVALTRPGFTIAAQRSTELEVSGSDSTETSLIAKKLMEKWGLPDGVHLNVSENIPQHVGLGSGTQRCLGVGWAISRLYGLELPPREIAILTGRGGTSGIGLGAFESGGFIMDGGHSFGPGEEKTTFLPSHFCEAPPPPILVRYPVPDDWFFVVAIPNQSNRIFGEAEIQAFSEECPIPSTDVDRLSRIVMLQILPSIFLDDIKNFGKGITSIQQLGFKKREIQRQSPLVKEAIQFMLNQGAAGSGMSSFGPAVFGVVRTRQKAVKLESEVKEFLGKDTLVFLSNASQKGARITCR